MHLKARRFLPCLTILVTICLGKINLQQTASSSLQQAIEGYWGDWSKWGNCSTACGMAGYRKRTRLCDNPVPKNGGNPCSGPDVEMTSCFKPCAVHGNWGSWSGWKICSVTCGNGSEAYQRSCDNPAPNHGGRHCVGQSTKLVPCSAPPCATDGSWGDWSGWTSCSVTCGDGKEHRQRHCNNPHLLNGGRTCSGHRKGTRHCHQPQCITAIDGGWGAWSRWGHCSVKCGGGVKHRHRNCDNPSPQHSGKACLGNSTESQTCHNQQCPPIDGGWGAWSQWGNCTVKCGGGVKHRHRNCDNPSPQHGGKACSGNPIETQNCHDKQCPPQHGHWSDWSALSQCSVTCNGGTQHRTRSCNGGLPCQGDHRETRHCNGGHCHHCHNQIGHDACIPVLITGRCRGVVGYTQCAKLCGHC